MRVRNSSLVLSGCIALLLAWSACGAGAVRPRFEPFPQAIADTIHAEPAELVGWVVDVLNHEGIDIRWIRIREGYVETRWFHATTMQTGGGNSLNTREIIRMRFWTDLVAEHESVLVGEAVYRRVVDPSLPPRQREAHVPRDHPGFTILTGIIEEVASGEHEHEHEH